MNWTDGRGWRGDNYVYVTCTCARSNAFKQTQAIPLLPLHWRSKYTYPAIFDARTIVEGRGIFFWSPLNASFWLSRFECEQKRCLSKHLLSPSSACACRWPIGSEASRCLTFWSSTYQWRLKWVALVRRPTSVIVILSAAYIERTQVTESLKHKDRNKES